MSVLEKGTQDTGPVGRIQKMIGERHPEVAATILREIHPEAVVWRGDPALDVLTRFERLWCSSWRPAARCSTVSKGT